MNITEVRVRRVASGGKLKAFASITIDGVFVVHDLKVIEGHKGLFVAMPSRKMSNGEFKDIAHPIATEAREMIQSRIIEEYNRQCAEERGGEAAASEAGAGVVTGAADSADGSSDAMEETDVVGNDV